MFVKQKDNGIFLYEQRKKEEKIKGGFTMKLVSKKKKNNKGFSLVELIVVVLIIAIIAVALAPQVMKWVGTAKDNVDKNNMASIKSSIQIALVEFESAGNTLKKTTIEINKTGVVVTEPSTDSVYCTKLKEKIEGVFGGSYPSPETKDSKFQVVIDTEKSNNISVSIP